MTIYTFFIGCTHFEHDDIIHLCQRPFRNADHMNESLVENWNSRVRPQDEVYHLGDIAWGDFGLDWLRRLNGKIRIIPGNHDHPADLKAYNANGFQVLDPIEDIMVNSIWVNLCHYPIEDWNGRYKGSLHLHCHTHGKAFRRPSLPMVAKSELTGHANDVGEGLPKKYPPERKCNRFNVGVDATNFFPVSMEEIMEEMWKDD